PGTYRRWRKLLLPVEVEVIGGRIVWRVRPGKRGHKEKGAGRVALIEEAERLAHRPVRGVQELRCVIRAGQPGVHVDPVIVAIIIARSVGLIPAGVVGEEAWRLLPGGLIKN